CDYANRKVSYLTSNLVNKVLSGKAGRRLRGQSMSTENPVSPIPAKTGSPHHHAELASTAGGELAAFLAGVRRGFSPEAASRAGDCWLEAFEAADPPAN